ncbi:MAG: glutathione S-transferase family protein [Pseudomonadota bacterium]
MLTLYLRTGACAVASLIALKEAGADPQLYFAKPGEEAWPDYLTKNPRGTVPALEIDNTILTENVAILTYVAQAYPEANLWPEDLGRRAQCVSLVSWFSSTLHPARRQAFRPPFTSADEACHKGIQEAGREKYWNCMVELNDMLGDNEWLAVDF